MSESPPPERTRTTWTVGTPMAIGLGAALFLFVGLGLWASLTNISGAVMGEGKIVVSSDLTTVSHPKGGVVAEILVGNGDRVRAGDPLVRLDATELTAELRMVEAELFELLGNQARLDAIVAGQSELLPHFLLAEAAQENPAAAAVLERQKSQLDAQRASLAASSRLIGAQIRQVELQISGAEAERKSRADRLGVVEKELEATRELADQGLIRLSVLYSLEKDELQTEGEIGRLSARIAELEGRIAELSLNRLALEPNLQQKASDELDRLRPIAGRLIEKRDETRKQLANLEIRAPISGIVHDSQVEGIRSVVVAARPLLSIVPDGDPYVVQVRVDAADIDQVYYGQDASLKFRAFDGRSSPIILGQVEGISADAFLDTKTNKLYYHVDVSLNGDEMSKLEGKPLIPGMPVDAFLSTEPRTPLTYVLRPIMHYVDRTFRDA